jgi:hypothetical protein
MEKTFCRCNEKVGPVTKVLSDRFIHSAALNARSASVENSNGSQQKLIYTALTNENCERRIAGASEPVITKEGKVISAPVIGRAAVTCIADYL